MEQPNKQTETDIETYPLDETVVAMLAEVQAQVGALNAQMQGALTLFMRQHGLQGSWRLAQNGKELEKSPQ